MSLAGTLPDVALKNGLFNVTNTPTAISEQLDAHRGRPSVDRRQPDDHGSSREGWENTSDISELDSAKVMHDDEVLE
jgi:hypothetical protein